MKTQEIVEYHLYPVAGNEPQIVTESYNVANRHFKKGWFVQELHTMRWQPAPNTSTSTTVLIDWQH